MLFSNPPPTHRTGHPNIYEPEIYFKMSKVGAAPMSNSIIINNFEAKMLGVISSWGVNSF